MSLLRRAWFGGAFIFGLATGCGGLADGTLGNGTVPGATSPGGTESDPSSVCPEPIVPAAGCACSRRACYAPSMNCPRGAGKTTTTRIGASGGTVSLDGTAATIGVPASVKVFPGSLSGTEDVKLSELDVPTPNGYEDWSPLYALEPLSLEFTNGGAISLSWQVPHPGGGVVPKTLSIYTSASLDGPWQPMPDNYDNAGFSQATVLGGGYFFVGYPEANDACQ